MVNEENLKIDIFYEEYIFYIKRRKGEIYEVEKVEKVSCNVDNDERIFNENN